MPRLIATWTAGKLIQLKWSYRLWQLDDDAYHLEAKLEFQSEEHYAPAYGHHEAHKMAAALIALDRERCAAEELAYLEAERREKVTDIGTGRRTG